MPEFFTVDRSGSLSAGQVHDVDLDLSGRKFYSVRGLYTEADLENLARDLFADGLSEFGKRYLLDEFIITYDGAGAPTPYVPNTPVTELVAELVRRTSYPDHPSRFACAFGWRTLQEARTFEASYPQPGTTVPRIFRVSCNRTSRHDMSLLKLGGTILGAWLYATKYWRGESGPDPVWEELLVPPVTVMERVG